MKVQAVIDALKCLEGHVVNAEMIDGIGYKVVKARRLPKKDRANAEYNIVLDSGTESMNKAGTFMPDGITVCSQRILGIEPDGRGVIVTFKASDGRTGTRAIRITDEDVQG